MAVSAMLPYPSPMWGLGCVIWLPFSLAYAQLLRACPVCLAFDSYHCYQAMGKLADMCML